MNEPTASKLLEGFGLRLTAARLAAGFATRKDLAEELGIDQNTYSPWERGRTYPNPKALYAIKRRLRVTTDYLYYAEINTLQVDVYQDIMAKIPEAQAIHGSSSTS